MNLINKGGHIAAARQDNLQRLGLALIGEVRIELLPEPAGVRANDVIVV
jgi:hypothetical protein